MESEKGSRMTACWSPYAKRAIQNIMKENRK
jgi:hypothetical protein